MRYDIIIAGGGAAGLSFVHHLLKRDLNDVRILIIDKDLKQTNDRTWCYWTTEPDDFAPILKASWNSLTFTNYEFTRTQSLGTYQYNCLQGIDFYNFIFEEIRDNPQISFIQEDVKSIIPAESHVSVVCNDQKFVTSYVIDSISLPTKNTLQGICLFQNFAGWTVETSDEHLDCAAPTLMDFRCKTQTPPGFFYILPFAKNNALIEFTRFDKSPVISPEYECHLQDYIEQTLGIHTYSVKAVEKGSIPMANHPFPAKNGDRVYRVGTAGGDTKPTTGYTFRNIQKHVNAVLDELQGIPTMDHTVKRFAFYDDLLLNIMHDKPELVTQIMGDLFAHNDFSQILKFLDEETHLIEEVPLLTSLPWKPFLLALYQQKISL